MKLGLDLDKRAFDGKVRDFSRALAAADAGRPATWSMGARHVPLNKKPH